MKTKSIHTTLVQMFKPRRNEERKEQKRSAQNYPSCSSFLRGLDLSSLFRFRKKGAIVVVFALMALLAKPQVAFAQAQTPPAPIIGSWEGLKAIPPGDEVRVRLRNGQTLKGRLISVSGTNMTLSQGNITTDVTRGDALRVYRVITKSAKKATLIGLGIGAGVGGMGAGVAVAGASGGPKEYGLVGFIFGAIGAGVGALIGYIVGSRKHRALIYETM
jgi:small nuclear ribonucleoprotein (snRNP)-like protein